MEAELKKRAEAFASDIASNANTIDDLNSVMKTLMKTALERMLSSELNVHLQQSKLVSLVPLGEPEIEGSEDPSKPRNRRNGSSSKTVRADMGKLQLDIPRDRAGTFEPQLVKKHDRQLAGFDEKILAMYAKGMTTRDIQELVKQLYGIDISASFVSQITEDIEIQVRDWQQRRLSSVWPIVYLDGIVVHVRDEQGRVREQTVYIALGINLSGKKELLGLWISENEGAKFWLSCLTDLKNRGLDDILIVCVDGLSGFPEAIKTAYPKATVQLCIVHLVRAALRYVNDEDSREVVTDLKKIYQAASALEAEQELKNFANRWDTKYPTISKQWRLKWPQIIAMFEFPTAIRKAIYTTNAIESVNSVIRKYTRNRKQYPNSESTLKLIYMAINEASKKWTMPIPKWKEALNHFAIHFDGRIPANINR